MAIKAYRTIRAVRKQPSPEPRERRVLEPASIGMVGEAAVKLGFQGVPRTQAMEKIAQAVPPVKVSEYLREIAARSLKGVERIREELEKEHGRISIIGKGEGRHPDLGGRLQPDFVAFRDRNRIPVIVETKNTTRSNPTDNFQASLYNGIAERYGLYVVEERLEGKIRLFSPHTIHGSAETFLIYPRLATYSIVKDRFVPDDKMIKGIWKAKELGFKGLVPENDCPVSCAHNRLKVKLAEENMEPLPPLPLIFSKGVLESGFSYDLGFQVTYAWNLLPTKVKLAILFSAQRPVTDLDALKEWLTKTVGLEDEAAEATVNVRRRDEFLRSRPNAEGLMKSIGSELEPWGTILKERLDASGPSILAIATAVYSLPKRSYRFVQDAWNRWS